MEERQFIMCFTISKRDDNRVGMHIVTAKSKYEAMGVLMEELNKNYPEYNFYINPSMASVDTDVIIEREN